MEGVLGYIGVLGLVIALTWRKYPWPKSQPYTWREVGELVATLAVVCGAGYLLIGLVIGLFA